MPQPPDNEEEGDDEEEEEDEADEGQLRDFLRGLDIDPATEVPEDRDRTRRVLNEIIDDRENRPQHRIQAVKALDKMNADASLSGEDLSACSPKELDRLVRDVVIPAVTAYMRPDKRKRARKDEPEDPAQP